METGYRELAGERTAGAPTGGGEAGGDQDELVRAALHASLPTIPD